MSADDTGMPGSPAANQSKTESMPPTQGHADPDAAPEPASVEVPDLEAMNVGAGDPQAPSHDAAGSRRSFAGGDAAVTAVQDTVGAGYRQPGSLGTTGPDEQIETDVARSAGNTDVAGRPGTDAGPGDPRGVPVVSETPAPGTSQESGVAQGSRTPA